MEGEEGMNKGLMYGLIGVGIALVIAAVFIFLAIAGPKMAASSASDSAALQTKADDLQAKLDASVNALADAQKSISAKDTQITSLQKQVNDLKYVANSVPTPTPPVINTTNTTNTTKPLNITDFSTLTKDNCNDAILLARKNESAARNTTQNLSRQLDVMNTQLVNLTSLLDNATNGNASDRSERIDYFNNQISDQNDLITNTKSEIDKSVAYEKVASDLRRRIVAQCNKLMTAP